MTFSESSGQRPPLGGRYALREPLGEGTFAVTYLADDLVLGRLVAVKVLRAQYGSDPAAAARFEREARAAASVASPYVVDVFDYGSDRGALYIVLQYVAGPTLREQLDRDGPFTPSHAVRVAVDVLRGLSAIHAAGIIHRDVKPQNVLLDWDGRARVADFGVAYWTGGEALTSHGLAVGTAIYMAPEQAHGSRVSEATDLYAVGILLFEMLTGRLPFKGDNPAAVMLAHVQQQPPLPTEVAPGLTIPVPLEREVMRALAKRPQDRWQSADEMAKALERALASGTETDLSHLRQQPEKDATATTPLPALASTPAAQTQLAEAADTPARRSRSTQRSWAWIGPLAVVAVALAILTTVAARGGFAGLADLDGPSGERSIAGLLDRTPSPSPTSAPSPTEEPAGAVLDLVPQSTQPASSLDPPTIAPATLPPTPTQAPLPTATPEPAPPVAPTEPPALDEADVDSETGERRNRRNRNREQVEEISEAGNSIAAGPEVQFGGGDWFGADAAPASFGRAGVALFGAESSSSRAVLQFNLSEPPVGRMVLTVTGLGDDTGRAFPFGIEINGMYVGESPASFANWHPARDGLDGERAEWSQIRVTLPPEVFQAGLNEVAIVSLFPGDYEGRPPYLLLSDTTLAPE